MGILAGNKLNGNRDRSAFGIELMWYYQRVKEAWHTLAEKSYFYFLNLH